MALLLTAYAVMWTLYGIIAKGSQDIHFDMGEMVSWSHEVVLGTPKHPPLAAWLVRLWFEIFPAQGWAYYLFAVVLATLALWVAWHVAAPFCSPQKRVVGVVLLSLVPFYNFHALKFNANTVLIPFWALTTWWFLRSLETRRAGWAVLAGAGAAASVLGKYWSLFFLAGLGVAALGDPRRRLYFRSAAPWLTIAVGTLLIAPHVAWVVTHDFESLRYAFGSHPATYLSATAHAFVFLAGVLAFIAAPIVLGLLAARPSAAAIRDTLWPTDDQRRTIVVAFVAPILIAALSAIPLKVTVGSLWMMSGMTLLPIVLLSSPLVTITRSSTVWLLTAAIVYPTLMVVASPVIAMVIHREGVTHYAAHYRLIARAVERAWVDHTKAPLRIVGSDSPIVNGIVFYFEEQPSTLEILNHAETPWVDENRIKHEGAAVVCPLPESACITALAAYAKRFHDIEITDVALARRYFGALDTPVHYRILIIPPQ